MQKVEAGKGKKKQKSKEAESRGDVSSVRAGFGQQPDKRSIHDSMISMDMTSTSLQMIRGDLVFEW